MRDRHYERRRSRSRSPRPRRGSESDSYRRRRSRSRERRARYDDRGPSRYGRSPPRRRGSRSRSRSPPRRAFGRAGGFSAAATTPSATASFTLIARQLPPSATEASVRAAFGAYGDVAAVRLIADAASGRCLGVGYVEMGSEAAFNAALAAHTLVLEGGLPILISAGAVQPAAAAPPPPPVAVAVAPPPPPLVAPPGGGEAAAWGGQPAIAAALSAEVAAAVAAATAKLATMQRQPPLPPPLAPPPPLRPPPLPGAAAGLAIAAAVAASLSAGVPSSLPAPPPPPTGLLPLGGGAPEAVARDDTALDEDGGGGGGAARLGVAGRTALMSKLALTANLQLPAHTLRATAAAVPTLGCDELQSLQLQGGARTEALSRCLVLKGMFDRLSAEAEAPNFYSELEADVRAECAALATGAVLHVAADRWSNGFMYAKFELLRDAVSALARLDGRWFARQRIRAEHVPEAEYERKWPKAKAAGAPPPAP